MTGVVDHQLRRLSTPRAAALAGVLFAVIFGTALVLIRTALPDGAAPGSQWADGSRQLRTAAVLMPFAGIAFLWFIGVVRDGFGRYEDRFFATVFFGSGLLFLAMMFVASGVGAGLETMSGHAAGSAAVALGQSVLLSISKTYALRMAAVFMMSLATIWLRTGLMPRPLVWGTYALAVVLLAAAEVSMWLTLAFPAWVLVVSLLLLRRSLTPAPGAAPRPDTA
ncbi:hypothetical protein NIIDNTM18_05620 [Mycolicibacterium litorale]|uniref:DUF4386 domain-containing protein n=1 Tax=Mycolicibacterium litorale TaxID=758802 RepID=A0A6S6NY06_9MYCO|nr:hypothetical protein [Mycolicibacterium litorale]BCI51284.1 hypothetical protein NIIDNTM18_05620 [Mycolicibacterium litorale]